MEREIKGGRDGPPVQSLDESRPDRETFVTSMTAEFGGERSKWDADYDRLEKAWGE